MPSEKLSTHEIRMARNAERERHARMGTTPTVATVRTQPHPEERAQAARLSAARALPDTLFDDDPEVQRLRAAASLKVHLIEKRVQVRDWLAEQQSRLDSFIEEAARAVPQAILEDAAGRDEGFTKTREALAALDFAKSVCAGINAAYAMVAQSNPAAQHELHNARDAAHTALAERLFALKLTHMGAQALASLEPEGEQ